MTIAELNAADLDGFVAALGWVFEGSPWVAERAWTERPFEAIDALHGVMVAIVEGADPAEQLALLKAHPELGVLASAPRETAALSDASKREQAGAGLNNLTRDEVDRLRALNSAYREKFGFPFLYAVKGSTKQDVLNALERRLTSTRDAERHEALRQVYRIARFRLEEAIARA